MSGNLVQLREMRPPDRAAALQLIGEQTVGVYEKLGYKTRAFKMLKKIG